MLQEIGNAAVLRRSEAIGRAWSNYNEDLIGARGLFVVEDRADELSIPGDRDFAGQGFLRCLMASRRLQLIQSERGARDFRYSAPIFCDTNFVSYCGAFAAGRNLGAIHDAFTESVRFLLPFRDSLGAYPYLVENAENPDEVKVRSSLIGFAALKVTAPADFSRDGEFAASESHEVEQIVQGCMAEMRKAEFATVQQWVKQQHYLPSRVVLLKAAVIAFSEPQASIAHKMEVLHQFLHGNLARMHNFQLYVASRFFSVSANETFFSGVQRNAARLDTVLRSMAWDLAHWRTMFDLITVKSSRSNETAFPIPHFLSFDKRFIDLIETFQLDGIIYAANGRRCEQFYSRQLLEPVSDLLRTSLARFYSADALQDREARSSNEAALDAHLVNLEGDLAEELKNRLK